MWTKTDVEEEARPLYPMMLESPELRWSFIRKIYPIICIQLFATITVAATVISIPPIAHFFANTSAGLALYVFLVITTFVSIVVPVVFLFPEASGDLRSPRDLHHFSRVRDWIGLCIHEWISTMIYGCLASLLYCAYIVYDTDNLIKRYTYDEYIRAAVTLYVDIINLFLSLLTIFRAADS
ncbi:hypothetical protein TIFTF001_018032 [Ficus carica]|uniref:Uncharacterized protein n=1 Tax=Ficus carica TaxID=3494 RepID=A0AA88DAD1_FICCA|nr:hypothetical protein TIFTF001_018032 [Ficus carica]